MFHQRFRPIVYALALFSLSLFLASCSEPQTPATGSNVPPAASADTMQSQQTQQAAKAPVVPEINITDLATLMVNVEDKFGLKNVLISQAGPAITVRMMAPTITGSELDGGLVQVFAYLSDNLPADIQTFELVFDINNVDSAVISVGRSDIQSWQKGQLDNAGFIKKFKKTSLL